MDTEGVLFCLVAQESRILIAASRPNIDGNFEEISQQIVQSLAQAPEDNTAATSAGAAASETVQTLNADAHNFHYMRGEHGALFLCLSGAALPRREAVRFLRDLHRAFRKHAKDDRTLSSQSLRPFRSVMVRMLQLTVEDADVETLPSDPVRSASRAPASAPSGRTASKLGDDEKLVRVSEALNEAKLTIRENVDLAVQRGDTLDLLEDRTEQLSLTSNTFRSRGADLRRRMCVDLMKQRLCVASMVLLILYLFLSMLCGFDLSC